MLSYFKKIREFVNKTVIDSPVPDKFKKFDQELKKSQLKHYERTVFWVKKLNPNIAEESLLIAAYAHDIERWIRNPKVIRKISQKEHQEEGAKIVSKFLEKLSADRKLINDVYYLISHHEAGGNYKANILKDADSISFFENNIQIQAKLFPNGLKKKIELMYKRISLPKAKKYIKPFYVKSIKFIKAQK